MSSQHLVFSHLKCPVTSPPQHQCSVVCLYHQYSVISSAQSPHLLYISVQWSDSITSIQSSQVPNHLTSSTKLPVTSSFSSPSNSVATWARDLPIESASRKKLKNMEHKADKKWRNFSFHQDYVKFCFQLCTCPCSGGPWMQKSRSPLLRVQSYQ